MDTDRAWRQYRREYEREITQRDKARAHAGKMSAATFARIHRLDPRRLRERMREAGYDRQGKTYVPIKDLEKFL